MRRLWNVISVVAVVNLAAVVGVVAWLASTGRLTRDTADGIRALLAAPASDGSLLVGSGRAVQEEARDVTPITEQLTASDRLAQQTAMNMRRLREESEQLARRLGENESELQAREAAFAAERQRWLEATAEEREQATADQFRKAVKTLESVPPKQAKEWILALCAAGKVEQAVAYLDAMSAYKSAGVFKAFKGDEENKVATDLLERLRRRAPAGGAAGDSDPATADSTAPSTLSNTALHAAGSAPNATATPAAGSRPVANAGAEVDRPGSARR